LSEDDVEGAGALGQPYFSLRLKGGKTMARLKYPQKRIAPCPKCKKQTAWLYIGGARTFWLCLLCATREEAQMTEKPDRHKEVFAKVEDTTTAARETLARINAVLDQTRQQLRELNESRQLHRAITEHKAEQCPRPHSEQLPALQESDAPPETMPSSEPPTKNESA
jgi:hypothetical protein